MNTKRINFEFIRKYKNKHTDYPPPKWILFCEEMLSLGFIVKLCRSKSTVSKYIYISKNSLQLKIRFSNHKPSLHKELSEDCDYYVGIYNKGWITTDTIIKRIKERI